MPDEPHDNPNADPELTRCSIFCLECNYPLDLLPSNVCPECGREFDRVDESTYRYLPGPALDDPVVLARLSIAEAVGLCVRLEQAGITFALHEERGGVIAYAELPTGSVWVEREDKDDARAVMAQPIEEEHRMPWICGRCGEHIEGQFAICRNCGAERE